jgi:predicted ATP-grasp superfamily ATP-dependent carboligase
MEMRKSMQEKSQWRRQFKVLVPDAHALGSIAVTRSLGRAGYEVHVCDADAKALGLRSNFAASATVCPPYRDPGFLEWLQKYVRDESISLVIPSEGFLHAIAPEFDRFSSIMPISPDASIVYRAFSKIDVIEHLRSTPENDHILCHIPPTLIVRRGDPLPTIEALRGLGMPIYLKSDAKYSSKDDDAFLMRIADLERAHGEIARALEDYEALLIQGFVPGRKAAAAFCLKNGRVLAASDVLGLRTSPHTGGMMSLRVSSRNEALHASALAWLRLLNWEGVAMVECKWDPSSDRYWLIEFNTRYWGYLHLDLFSGVDMPTIQADAFFGAPDADPPVQKLGIITRHTIPGDSGFLLSLLRDNGVSLRKKAAGIFRFVLDFLNPSIRSDLLFPGDRKLYWIQWHQFFMDIFRRWRFLR